MAEYRQFCGLARALDVIGDRWNLLIVRELLIAERRHHELKAALPGIATNLLSERLRDLADAGVIERREEPGRRPVSYVLTELGRDLREPVLGLVRWGARRMTAGPRPDDVVQPQWIALALEALLPSTGMPEGAILLRADGCEFTLRTSRRGSHVEPGATVEPDATVDAPAAVILGLFAGALPQAGPALAAARIDDPAGHLDAVLTRIATQDRTDAARS